MTPVSAAASRLAEPAAADSCAVDPYGAAFDGGTVDTFIVSAARPERSVFPWGAAVLTVVPLEDKRGGGDLAELLARTAGLQIRRFGGLGAEAIPSIRGSTGSQVVVMVDGVPLGDAQDGAIDLASLPLERFARAEIFRGLAPVTSGGIGGAGAVNLISREMQQPGADLRIFSGSFGDLGGRLMQQWQTAGGRLSQIAIVHGRRIDNRYLFWDHNQTFHNVDDDRCRRRINAQFQEYGGYLSSRWQADAFRLTAAAGYFRRDGGRPGPLGHESRQAGVRHHRADSRLTLASGGGLWRIDLTASTGEQLLHDDAAEVGLDPPGTLRSISSDLAGRFVVATGSDWERLPLLPADGAVRLRTGGDWRRQWYSQTFSGERDPLRVRTVVSAFANLELQLFGPRLMLSPAWRWQRAADNFPPVVPPWMPWLEEQPLEQPHVVEADSPSAGLVWEALAGRLFVESHASRTLRLPTWIELFGYRGGIDGNRELKPERITTYDLGLRWGGLHDRAQVRATLFTARTDQTVIFIQNSQRTSRPENFGSTTTQGLELEASQRIPGDWNWTLSLTWQRAVDRSDDPAYRDKQLPFLPPLEAFARLEKPFADWRTGLSLGYKAGNFRDRYNIALERAPARTVLGVWLSRTWLTGDGAGDGSVTVTAEAINITDNDVYDVEGFPLPGRSFRLSLHLR